MSMLFFLLIGFALVLVAVMDWRGLRPQKLRAAGKLFWWLTIAVVLLFLGLPFIDPRGVGGYGHFVIALTLLWLLALAGNGLIALAALFRAALSRRS